MKDVTILIQGLITQESYNFYIQNYPQYPIVISTWASHKLDLSYFPKNLTLILSKPPFEEGPQKMNYQFTSTVNGLKAIDTEYTIKVRGDEYYSNFKSLDSLIKTQPHKIYCSPIWFRHFKQWKYHISDHIIAGTTDNLKLMFNSSKIGFDNKSVRHLVDGQMKTFYEPEMHLTNSYLREKYGDEFDTLDGVQTMIDNFEIIDLKNLKPYKVVANVYNKVWISNYIPEENLSLSNINQLLEEPKF